MSKDFKRGCLIVCLFLGAVAAYSTYHIFSFPYYYGEAEPLADRLLQVWREVHQLENKGEPLPRTVEELLALLPEEDQKRFEGYQMDWNPAGDPRFKMRVNARYGFALTHTQLLWITKSEELDALFPSP